MLSTFCDSTALSYAARTLRISGLGSAGGWGAGAGAGGGAGAGWEITLSADGVSAGRGAAAAAGGASRETDSGWGDVTVAPRGSEAVSREGGGAGAAMAGGLRRAGLGRGVSTGGGAG